MFTSPPGGPVRDGDAFAAGGPSAPAGRRDRYVLEVSPPYDQRLAVALAICQDALQSR